jgi:VanZ family protein
LRREGLAIAELRPLAFASVILAIAFLQPFDVTLEVGAVASDVRMLERDMWQFSVLRDEGISIIICAFFSATLASYLSVLGEARAGRTTLVAGAIAIVMLEGSQFLIGSRTPSLWDVAVGWTGLILGVALWRQTTRIAAPAVWITLISLATLLAAAMQMLSPFQWTAEYRPMSWFPFRGYYTRTTFETLSHVIELALLYVPLGYWVGATSGESGSARRALLTTGALTVAIAGTVEYLQGWAAGRYSDVSDVGLCLLGAAVGVWAGRRALQGPFGHTAGVPDPIMPARR